MTATGTIAGRPFASSNLDIVSRLHQTELRLEARDFGGAAVGDELVLTLDGTPSVVAAVRTVAQRVGHEYLVAEPTVTQELRLALSRTVGPLVLDGETPTTIAGEVLPGVDVLVQTRLEVELPRWSTREREAAWAWRALLRTLAQHTGEPVTWRHDARVDAVVVEADRADWTDVADARRVLVMNGDWRLLTATPVQAGDLWDGTPVVYARTRLDREGPTHRTRIQTVAA